LWHAHKQDLSFFFLFFSIPSRKISNFCINFWNTTADPTDKLLSSIKPPSQAHWQRTPQVLFSPGSLTSQWVWTWDFCATKQGLYHWANTHCQGGQDLPFFIVLFFCGWQYLCILAGAYERTTKLADELQALECGDFNAQGMYVSLLLLGWSIITNMAMV